MFRGRRTLGNLDWRYAFGIYLILFIGGIFLLFFLTIWFRHTKVKVWHHSCHMLWETCTSSNKHWQQSLKWSVTAFLSIVHYLCVCVVCVLQQVIAACSCWLLTKKSFQWSWQLEICSEGILLLWVVINSMFLVIFTEKWPECSFRHEARMFRCHQINGKKRAWGRE